MKHTISITIILLSLFLLSHIIGLFIIKYYLSNDKQLPLNIEKPQFQEETSYLPIFITILIATGFALLLIKFSAFRLWKIWFLFSVFFTLTIGFSAFIPELFAILLSLPLSLWKTFKPNVYIHNFTELFIYGGLAAIFVPVLSIKSVFILLILISIYDGIAVWRTKHMVSLAKFQSKSNIFAGLLIPYNSKNIKNNINKKSKIVKTFNNAILGGGDIGFTLLFSGVILKTFGLTQALFISLIISVSLFLLFVFAKKDKFYPAMPFLSLGCLVGYLLLLI